MRSRARVRGCRRGGACGGTHGGRGSWRNCTPARDADEWYTLRSSCVVASEQQRYYIIASVMVGPDKQEAPRIQPPLAGPSATGKGEKKGWHDQLISAVVSSSIRRHTVTRGEESQQRASPLCLTLYRRTLLGSKDVMWCPGLSDRAFLRKLFIHSACPGRPWEPKGRSIFDSLKKG